MKRIEVVMKPSALDVFEGSAARLGISEYAVSEVRLSPSYALKERRRLYRGQEFGPDLLSRIKVEFAVLDEEHVTPIAEHLRALTAPDSIAILALEEIITPTGSRSLTPSHSEQGKTEVPAVIHH